MAALTTAILSVLARALGYMGAVKTATKLRAQEVVRAAASAGHVVEYVWGYDPNEANTEHHSGLAADFMVFGSKAAGDFIRNYLWDNRSRLRVKHVIWWQHITSTVVEPGKVRLMSDRGNTTANHKDHVHVYFLDDRAYAAPGVKVKPVKVKKSPKPQTPVRAKLPILKRGSKGASVAALQRGLNRAFPAYARLAADGDFGPRTEAAVVEFQRRSGLDPDGKVGPATRAELAKYGIRA